MRPTILIVGDVMLDAYHVGNVQRISPEAPIPVLTEGRVDYRLGGAANVALNVKDLGGTPLLVSCVGDDVAADRLEALLAENQISTGVARTASWTSLKTRFISEPWHPLLRVDTPKPARSGSSIRVEHVELALSIHELTFSDLDAVVISDYDHGSLSPKFIKWVMALAHENGIPTIVDPKPSNAHLFRGATLLKPNLSEAQTIVSRLNVMDSVVTADEHSLARSIAHELDTAFVVVSLGARGAICYDRDADEGLSIPSPRVLAVDPSGAGDTLIAGISVGLARGNSLYKSVHVGVEAAAAVVSVTGTASLGNEKSRSTFSPLHFSRKILHDREDLLEFVAERKKKRGKLVVTNGIFDLLHSGHVDFLNSARNLGDYLLVLVNSDESTKRLKGPGRPVNQLLQRLDLLASLEFVDGVFAFDEDTPLEVIKLVKPDLLVKGGDYRPVDVAGHAEIAAWGGKVVILERIKELSTTRLLESILARRDLGN